MTRRIGNVLIVEPESAQQCDYCGRVAELRPYGRNGAAICHPCGTKPENVATTEAAFGARLNVSESPSPTREQT